jgi:hypothetical protein
MCLLAYFAVMIFTFFKRWRTPFVLALLVLQISLPQASAQNPPATVVELFTSQGCDSCPPADKLLGELSGREDILALSFNVDYWDYLGWKDTLASPENTARQQAYSRSMKNRRIYTPQMVIGGAIDAVGSDRSGVARAITAEQSRKMPRIDVHFAKKDGMTLVQITGAAYANEATIWLVRYNRETLVRIRRGENAGKDITYHNVVKDYKSLGLWRGHSMEIALDTKALKNGGADSCAILVQLNGNGPIVGAKQMYLGQG